MNETDELQELLQMGYTQNQMLRQLVDSALLSNAPLMPVFKPNNYEIEVNFDGLE